MKNKELKNLRLAVVLLLCIVVAGVTGCVEYVQKDDGLPRVKYFRASKDAVQPGESVKLRWSTRDAEQVEVTGIGEVGYRGSLEVIPDRNTTYILRARNAFGVDTHSVTVRLLTEGGELSVPAPPVEDPYAAPAPSSDPAPPAEETQPASAQPEEPPGISFFAVSKATIVRGETALLRWITGYADDVYISGLGRVSSNGTREIAPTRDTTYTIRAQNENGEVSRSVNINVISKSTVPSKTIPKKTVTLKAIAAPRVISPAEGSVFNHYPRRMVLRWGAVKGAASYTVEVQFGDHDSWDTAVTWKLERGIKDTHYYFNFIGAQPGRWRVWAVNAKGESGYKSEWRSFSFTR